MQYGYFDDPAREYVITRPDTPLSWSNYLGEKSYGGIITNNAGGYSFSESAAQGRFLRLRFNSVPMDQPGRYFYLRDADSGDYWSASWQPVGKPLEQYASTCRHGTGYTIINSRYAEIESEAAYYVPQGAQHEVWALTVTNHSERPRKLDIFSFCEFANNWDTTQDLVNLQYSLFIVRGWFRDGALEISINDHLSRPSGGIEDNDQGRKAWMTLDGAAVTGFDTSREAFLGPYRTYANPLAVERGACGDSEAYGDNACGSLQAALTLQPGERRMIVVRVGVGRRPAALPFLQKPLQAAIDEQLSALKSYWHGFLDALQVQTPDPAFDSTVNMWGLYNCLVTFHWSRAASLVYNGERNGLGFRDSVQDVLGIAAADPEAARQRLCLMLTGQLAHGGAMPVIKPFDHRPGEEQPTPPEHLRSDDCLWFFNAVPLYVAESGDLEFYDLELPYADQGKATVLGHLRRALEFNLERTGANGLPCGLEADWNDCLKLGYHGESLFVGFQLFYGLGVYAEIAERLGKPEQAAWARAEQQRMGQVIQNTGWDGGWFLWAIGEDGTRYGTKEMEEGQVYLNTQVWSVLSGAATPQQAQAALEVVAQRLATPYGLALCDPPFHNTSIEVMRAVLFNDGIKENGGIFNHTLGWGVLAECAVGNSQRAYEYLRAGLPAAYNERAELRQAEPYVQAQTTYSTTSPRAGNTRVSWLTGAAAWMYHAMTHGILGIRPELDGLRVQPCLPPEWSGYRAVRRYRSRIVRIEVRRGEQPGVTLNGAPLPDGLARLEMLLPENDLVVTLAG